MESIDIMPAGPVSYTAARGGVRVQVCVPSFVAAAAGGRDRAAADSAWEFIERAAAARLDAVEIARF